MLLSCTIIAALLNILSFDHILGLTKDIKKLKKIGKYLKEDVGARKHWKGIS